MHGVAHLNIPSELTTHFSFKLKMACHGDVSQVRILGELLKQNQRQRVR